MNFFRLSFFLSFLLSFSLAEFDSLCLIGRRSVRRPGLLHPGGTNECASESGEKQILGSKINPSNWPPPPPKIRKIARVTQLDAVFTRGRRGDISALESFVYFY